MDWNNDHSNHLDHESNPSEVKDDKKRTLRPSEKRKLKARQNASDTNGMRKDGQNLSGNIDKKASSKTDEAPSKEKQRAFDWLKLPKAKRTAQSKIDKTTQTKHKFPWKMLGIFIPFVLLFLVAVYLLSPLNHIQFVQVAQTENVSSDEEVEISGINKKMTRSYLLSNKTRIENHIVNQLPLVKTATVRLNDWRKVEITIEEYRQLGYIQDAEFYYPILENKMKITEGAAQVPNNRPLFISFEGDNLSLLTEQLTSVSDEVIDQIASVELLESEGQEGRVALKMRDGNIVLGLLPSLGSKLQYYKSIHDQLEGKVGLIDMQVGVFFQELTPANDPYATLEEREAYEKEMNPDTDSETETSEESQPVDVPEADDNANPAENESSVDSQD